MRRSRRSCIGVGPPGRRRVSTRRRMPSGIAGRHPGSASGRYECRDPRIRKSPQETPVRLSRRGFPEVGAAISRAVRPCADPPAQRRSADRDERPPCTPGWPRRTVLGIATAARGFLGRALPSGRGGWLLGRPPRRRSSPFGAPAARPSRCGIERPSDRGGSLPETRPPPPRTSRSASALCPSGSEGQPYRAIVRGLCGKPTARPPSRPSSSTAIPARGTRPKISDRSRSPCGRRLRLRRSPASAYDTFRCSYAIARPGSPGGRSRVRFETPPRRDPNRSSPSKWCPEIDGRGRTSDRGRPLGDTRPPPPSNRRSHIRSTRVRGRLLHSGVGVRPRFSCNR